MEVLIILGIVIGIGFTVVQWILRVYVFGKFIHSTLGALYTQQYQPQLQYWQSLLSQWQVASSQQRSQQLAETEAAYQTVSQTFQSLPRAEQARARPDLDRLRQQWRAIKGA